MSYDELMSEYQKTQIEYQKAQQKYQETQNKYNQTQEQYQQVQNENQKLIEENNKLKLKIENQALQLNVLNKYVFGTKKETTPKEENLVEGVQISLFGEPDDKELNQQIEEETEKITVHKKKNSKKVQAGIKKSFLKDVEIIREEYKLEEDKEKCPVCEGKLKQVGKEVVRQEIEFIPAKFKIKSYVRYTYKCEKCGTNDSKKETPTFVKTKLPNAILTHSFVSPSLATEVIYQKYYMGVPLYRQEKVWDDRGLVLPRSMMSNWCIKLTEYYFNDLYKLMLKKIKSNSQVLHCDETTMQCNKEVGRKATSNSYMWVLSSGELEKEKGVIFSYNTSRSAETAKNLLSDYKGILVTDGYSSYNNIENVKHAECWAHCRRKFYESVPLNSNGKMDTSCDGYKGVKFCDKLFEIENEIADLSVDKKLKIRNEKSKPILEKFFDWVNLTMSEKVIVNNKLKAAFVYASNQSKELSEFLNDGRIPLTNSLAERAIRPFAVHRKNWLFADSVEGANANAVLYSLIESAKLNKLNVNKYINYLLEQLPQLENLDENSLERYLPWSTELPTDVLNFEGSYKELNLDDVTV